MKDAGDFSKEDRAGRNLHFGVRELAMAAIGNGIMLHGGLRAYVSTFFVFSDYCKPMARLSALMGVPLTYVFTHDSIGVGEDGPTHEPIEQMAALRAMPNFHVFRPCDATETEAAWYSAVTSEHTPTALVLTRQNLEPMAGSSREALKGGYIIDDCEGTPELILIASGSEVALAVHAKETLAAEDPCRIHAVYGSVRGAERGVQGVRTSERSTPPCSSRGAWKLRLGQVHRLRRQDHRDGKFRRQRTGRASVQEVRLYR